MSPPHNLAPRGFTLIEATMAVVVTSILLVGMGSALVMTVGAAETGDAPASRAARAAEALAQLNAELSVATDLPTFTPGDILFTVPDRNADGSVEKIEYTWSGRAGDPLMRSYNAATPVAVAADIRSISVVSATRPPAQPVESTEQILKQCDAPPGAVAFTFDVDDKNYVAQYVRPTLPSGAVSWKITKIKMYLKRQSGNSNNLRLSIRTADSKGKPTSTMLASVSYSSSMLPSSGGWIETAIGPISGLGPTQGICIVLDGQVNAGTATVTYYQGGSSLPYNTHFMTTSDSFTTWSTPSDSKDMRFILTGTYATMVEP